MKVLKTADTSKWSHKFTCGQCDSQLEAEPGDVKYEFHSGYGRDADYETWTVQCPICQYQHNILVQDIPKVLQVKIKNKQLPSPGTSFVNICDDGKESPWQKRD